MALSRRRSLALFAGLIASPRLLLGQERAASDERPPAPATQRSLPASLGAHCDSLLERAIRSPYGFGWNEEEQGVDLIRSRPRGKPPAISSALTARASLLLHFVGTAYQQPRYISAAIEAGRGVLAVQTRPGQIRAMGVMGAFGGTKDEAADVPDRRPTCLALAALLTILASQETPDVRLKGPAQKAAHWIASQQTKAGGWPNIYPANAKKGEGTRLMVLNETDHRDSALAVLLASEILSNENSLGEQKPDKQLQLSFARATENLLLMRVAAGKPPTRVLWPTLCKLDGDTNTRQADVPVCIDLLSTRYATEVLLAGYLVTQETQYNDVLKEARDVISALPRDEQKQWYRQYDLQHKPILPPAVEEGSVFTPPPQPGPPLAPTMTPELFSRLEQSQEKGAKRMAADLEQSMPLLQRLSLLLGGVLPTALLIDAPQDPAVAAPSPDVAGGALTGTIMAAWREIDVWNIKTQ